MLLAVPLDATEFRLAFGAWSLVSLAIASYVASSMTSPVKVGIADQSRGFCGCGFAIPITIHLPSNK